VPRPIDPSEIPEEVTRFAEAQVAAGRFASVADVLRASVEALEERDAVAADWNDYLRDRFEEGRKAVERGEYFSGPPAELIARIRDRVEAKHR